MTQAAARLGVDRGTIARWVKKGKLKAHPDPGDDRRKLILVSEIEDLERRILELA